VIELQYSTSKRVSVLNGLTLFWLNKNERMTCIETRTHPPNYGIVRRK